MAIVNSKGIDHHSVPLKRAGPAAYLMKTLVEMTSVTSAVPDFMLLCFYFIIVASKAAVNKYREQSRIDLFNSNYLAGHEILTGKSTDLPSLFNRWEGSLAPETTCILLLLI